MILVINDINGYVPIKCERERKTICKNMRFNVNCCNVNILPSYLKFMQYFYTDKTKRCLQKSKIERFHYLFNLDLKSSSIAGSTKTFITKYYITSRILILQTQTLDYKQPNC